MNAKKAVTVDDLLEYATIEKQEQITESIKMLRDSGFLRTTSIINHGRFETQLIPEGGIEYKHGVKKDRVEIIKTNAKRKVGIKTN